MKYFDYVQSLAESGKTSGQNQSEKYIEYTQLAYRRMKRWNKVGQLIPEIVDSINNIRETQHWIVLTESWCGDAAHAYMFIQKMADLNTNITLEWKLRDENEDLMNQYLTNGGKAIPKLIVFNKSGDELFHWGPRPQPIQEKYWDLRNQGVEYDEIMKTVQQMYNEDKGETMQKEILKLLTKS